MSGERLKSFKYAFSGISILFRTQPNARIHLVVMIAVIIAGLFFSLSTVEWCLIVLAIVIVPAAEAFNTALETLTDLVSPDYHELAGKTKDLAAAGVLIAAAGAFAIGLFIFLPRIAGIF